MHGVDCKISCLFWLVTAGSFVLIQNTGITNASTIKTPLQTDVTQQLSYTLENSDPKAGKTPLNKEKVEVGDAKSTTINETRKSNLPDDDQSTATLPRTVSENTGVDERTSRLERSTKPTSSKAISYGIHWTIFNNWQVLVGLAMFEIVVYVVTVTVVMAMHSRNRNLSRPEQDRKLISRFLFQCT
ncbi:uncharacterized protein [Asterias amurensis]|uniref:uncharacterized protein n=1 Tax=Asterias amurensis TaxID=7602 RepID=UPI003AB318CB